jgi:hypothetical protein
MHRFDEAHLVATLRGLPASAVVAFAASCATRLAEPYRIAQEYLCEGDAHIVHRSLDQLWLFAREGRDADWNAISEQLVALIPDEDDGSTFTHGIIDDALAATAYAARYALDQNVENAAFSARRVYETVDRFAGLALRVTGFDQTVETLLLESAVVQNELARQENDLRDLCATPADKMVQFIYNLRRRNLGVRALPLDLSSIRGER